MKRIKLLASLFFVFLCMSTMGIIYGGEYPAYEQFLKEAFAGKPYSGQPGKGKKIAFANIVNGSGFCDSVEASVIEHAMLAGFAREDIIIVNNQYNAVIGLKNSDIVLAKRPDVFIEFQFDAKVNNIVARKFKRAGIPIVAIDVPVPGAPFMGADNFGAAYMGGKTMAEMIKSKLGGIDKVDKIILLQFPTGGSATMMRSEGFVPALEEAFGVDVVASKLIKTDGGTGGTESAKKAMDDVLAANPDAKVWAGTAINHESIAGMIAAFEAAGRYDNSKVVFIGMGAGPLGQSQIRDNSVDGSVAFYPERYGQWAVPAAVARMIGKPVPPYIFPYHITITKANIDSVYPVK